jgi:hypothetical protein
MAKNTGDPARLIIPGTSWLTVKRVIRAFGAASSEDPSGEEIANLSGLQITVISSCSKFLRASSIVQTDKNELTEVGGRLFTAWDIDNQPMAVEALQEIVLSSQPLAQLVGAVRARGTVSTELFRGQIIAAAGLKGDSFLLPYVKTILDMLEESKLIQVTDDGITPGRPANGAAARRTESEKPMGDRSVPHTTNESGFANDTRTRTPIPLGPNRLAYIEFPKDWDNKELPKLLKMLALIFGSEE